MFLEEEKLLVYKIEDTEKVKELFEGWQETLIYSCLQKVMGTIYVTDLQKPKAAVAFVGCFCFYAGEPDDELVRHKPEGFLIMVPQNEMWATLIETCYPSARKTVRYAIKKDTSFDIDKLKEIMESLPAGYKLHRI